MASSTGDDMGEREEQKRTESAMGKVEAKKVGMRNRSGR
jgi:hypothetical protein